MGCTKVHLLRHRRVDPGIDPDQLFAGRARDSLMRTEDAKSNRAPMRSPIGQLNEDHRNFSRLLDVLESQLETALDPARHADFALMRDVMLYMTHYPDRFHHPKEELIFAALVIHDPSIRPVVDELREAHRRLAESGLELLGNLRNVVDGVLVERRTLELRGRGYLEALRAHIDTEEGVVFHRAEERMGEEDWIVIEREVERMDDPLFGDVVHADYRNLLEFIMREASL